MLTLFCAKAKPDRQKEAFCREILYLNRKVAEQARQLAAKDREILALRLAALEKRLDRPRT